MKKSDPKLWIFGYGSLIAASGINGRGMRRHYTEEDITECSVVGYKRRLNAPFPVYNQLDEHGNTINVRFFGITPEENSIVNGVLFPIAHEDVNQFINSEGGDIVYNFQIIPFEDVVFDHMQPNPIRVPEDARIYSCIPKNPSSKGYVTNNYAYRCNQALNKRSALFKQRFGKFYDYL